MTKSLDIWHEGRTPALDCLCKIPSQCGCFCWSQAEKSQFYSILQHINSIKPQFLKTQSLEICHEGSTFALDCKSKTSSQCCKFCRCYAQKGQFYSILQHVNSIKPEFPKTQSFEIWRKGRTPALSCTCKISSRCCSFHRSQPQKRQFYSILQHIYCIKPWCAITQRL